MDLTSIYNSEINEFFPFSVFNDYPAFVDIEGDGTPRRFFISDHPVMDIDYCITSIEEFNNWDGFKTKESLEKPPTRILAKGGLFQVRFGIDIFKLYESWKFIYSEELMDFDVIRRVRTFGSIEEVQEYLEDLVEDSLQLSYLQDIKDTKDNPKAVFYRIGPFDENVSSDDLVDKYLAAKENVSKYKMRLIQQILGFCLFAYGWVNYILVTGISLFNIVFVIGILLSILFIKSIFAEACSLDLSRKIKDKYGDVIERVEAYENNFHK